MILHEDIYVQITKKEKKPVTYNWFFYNMLPSPEDRQPVRYYSFTVEWLKGSGTGKSS